MSTGRSNGPLVDASSPAGRIGLSKRLDERRPTRPAKPTKSHQALVRVSAEDLVDLGKKVRRLEELGRDDGMDIRVEYWTDEGLLTPVLRRVEGGVDA